MSSHGPTVGADPRIGTELAGYRIEALIGRGGMSVVYLAEDLTLGRKVALKLISPKLSEDESFRERFRAEWRLAASIDHPNVIPIYEAGEAGETLFIAMRYVEGTDLKALLEEEGALEPKRALNLLSQVGAGLDAAHHRGLVHRDVKPSNVLISFDQDGEHAYLADFGLTKPASSAEEARTSIQLSGSSDYVSPEQITDGTAEARSDIYALGALLYESLTSVVPYPYERELQVLFAHVNDPPPKPTEVRPELPQELDEVIAKAMAKEPEDRHTTGGELAEAAAAAFPEPRRPRWQIAALIGILALLIAAAAAIPAILLTRGEEPKPRGTTAITTPVVQRIDPETNELVATVDVDPIAIAAGEGSVWAVPRTGSTLLAIDPETNAVREIDIGDVAAPDDVAVGGGAVWGLYRADSTFSYLANETGAVWRLDPATGSYSQRASSSIGPIEDLGVGDGSVWYVDLNLTAGSQLEPPASNLVQVDAETGVTTAAVPLVRDPQRFNGTVAKMAVGEEAVWLVFIPDFLSTRAMTSTELWQIDASTSDVRVVDLDFIPADVAAGEGAVWLSNGAGDTVLRVDAETHETLEITVGRIPRGIAVGEGAVWVANSRDGTVSRIDPKTLDKTPITVGGTPWAVTVGEGDVWATVSPP